MEKPNPRIRRRVASGEDDSSRVFRFRITLKDTKPPIWRRIETTDVTLGELHEEIQTAMGWTNSHLHQFTINGKRYTDARLMDDGFDDFGETDYTGIKLSSLLI